MNAAHAAGATTYTCSRARRILFEDDATTARGILATTRGGGRLTVDAPTVVIAAGTLHTPGSLPPAASPTRGSGATSRSIQPPPSGG